MALDFQQQVIAEFRANSGRVGGPFEGARLLLLTTTGARSGALHTVPLGYLPDGGHQFLVIGSAGGSLRHPAWFHNLVANPDTTAQVGPERRAVRARVADRRERERLWPRVVELYDGYEDYQRRTDREIPLVILEPRSG
jgi:deazaflavin-dependent oxidoreductase (nitroreductase family)